MSGMLIALKSIVSTEYLKRIDCIPLSEVQLVIDSWPKTIVYSRARSFGFIEDVDVLEIIIDYLRSIKHPAVAEASQVSKFSTVFRAGEEIKKILQDGILMKSKL